MAYFEKRAPASREPPADEGRVKQPSAKKVVVIGVVCGLFAVVLVRVAAAVLVGGAKALVVLAIAGLAWLVFGRKPSRQDDA